MTDPWAFGWDQLFGLVTAVSVGAGAVAAWVGLNTWRREQIERRQCELAEEALALLYEADYLFRGIRNPIAFAGEGNSRPAADSETKKQKQNRDTLYTPIERLENCRDFFDRVISIRPRFRAVFGHEAEKPLTEVLKNRNKIFAASNTLFHLTKGDGPQEGPASEKHQERIRSLEAILWRTDDEDDPIKVRLTEATENIESLVKPLLQSRYRNKSKGK